MKYQLTQPDIDLGKEGGQWRHGYIPLNAAAVRIKANGYASKGGADLPQSKLSDRPKLDTKTGIVTSGNITLGRVFKTRELNPSVRGGAYREVWSARSRRGLGTSTHPTRGEAMSALTGAPHEPKKRTPQTKVKPLNHAQERRRLRLEAKAAGTTISQADAAERMFGTGSKQHKAAVAKEAVSGKKTTPVANVKPVQDGLFPERPGDKVITSGPGKGKTGDQWKKIVAQDAANTAKNRAERDKAMSDRRTKMVAERRSQAESDHPETAKAWPKGTAVSVGPDSAGSVPVGEGWTVSHVQRNGYVRVTSKSGFGLDVLPSQLTRKAKRPTADEKRRAEDVRAHARTQARKAKS